MSRVRIIDSYKSIERIIYLPLLCVSLVLFGCSTIAPFGAGARKVFALKQDLLVYSYCGEYQLTCAPRDFTIAEFEKNPEIGVVDASDNIGYVAVLPKGTRIKATRVTRSFHWGNGCWEYYQWGKPLDKRFSKYRKLLITSYMLEGTDHNSGKFLQVVDPIDKLTLE